MNSKFCRWHAFLKLCYCKNCRYFLGIFGAVLIWIHNSRILIYFIISLMQSPFRENKRWLTPLSSMRACVCWWNASCRANAETDTFTRADKCCTSCLLENKKIIMFHLHCCCTLLRWRPVELQIDIPRRISHSSRSDISTIRRQGHAALHAEKQTVENEVAAAARSEMFSPRRVHIFFCERHPAFIIQHSLAL
jgi:hypothetical protein